MLSHEICPPFKKRKVFWFYAWSGKLDRRKLFFFFPIAILQYSNWNSENAHVSLKENPSLTAIKRDIPIVYVYYLVSESRC